MKQPTIVLLALLLAACGAPPTVTADVAAEAPRYQLEAIRARNKHQGDYLPAHNFKLEIDGVVISGLRAKVITDRDTGRSKGFRLMAPPDSEAGKFLAAWRKGAASGKTDRKSGSIIYLDRAGKEVMRGVFTGATPIISDQQHAHGLNARNSGHATEILEVVFERFEMK